MPSKKCILGFTLVELMVVLAIIAILAAVAYPSYNDQVMKTRRTDAHTSLLNMQAHMEHYYTENNSYLGATGPAAIGVATTSPEGFYNLSVSALTATSYTLTATPDAGGPQSGDTCGNITITNTNIKGPNLDCW